MLGITIINNDDWPSRNSAGSSRIIRNIGKVLRATTIIRAASCPACQATRIIWRLIIVITEKGLPGTGDLLALVHHRRSVSC